MKGDILTTTGKCFVSHKTASGARKWRVPKQTHLAEPNDFTPIELKPNQFVLRHRLSVDLKQASVTPNYATQNLTFNVFGYITPWPFIVSLANGVDYNTALIIANTFNAEKYVSDEQNKEAAAIALRESKAAEKKTKIDKEIEAIGCSINDAINSALLKAKTAAICLKRSPDIDKLKNAELNIRKMRHISFDVDDYLNDYIHVGKRDIWPFGDLYAELKTKLFK
ncbi:hypothetical protein H5185_12125 [Shewanella sp. SG44-6]|uniref:hypothetical protein n=1 Tax=Shewanella sp. SG44-6 TaxID=2760959 RepID=UPI001601670C|nr:hypothetical protein [Shewanella sp. SG44-6]MBB1390160.1 hypothetical protein [Shewanella sp. SG44-6]